MKYYVDAEKKKKMSDKFFTEPKSFTVRFRIVTVFTYLACIGVSAMIGYEYMYGGITPDTFYLSISTLVMCFVSYLAGYITKRKYGHTFEEYRTDEELSYCGGYIKYKYYNVKEELWLEYSFSLDDIVRIQKAKNADMYRFIGDIDISVTDVNGNAAPEYANRPKTSFVAISNYFAGFDLSKLPENM